MIATTISISIAGLSVLIAFFSLTRLYKNDSKTETKDQTESRVRMETKIDTIGEQIKDVRDDVKAQGVRQTDMMDRLTKVEESTKSAHHRIDGLEGRLNKEGD